MVPVGKRRAVSYYITSIHHDEHQRARSSEHGCKRLGSTHRRLHRHRSKLRADSVSLQVESLLRWRQHVPLFLILSSRHGRWLKTRTANTTRALCLRRWQGWTVVSNMVYWWDYPPPPLSEVHGPQCEVQRTTRIWATISSAVETSAHSPWVMCLYYLLFSLTLNFITLTHILLLLSAPVKAEVQSSLHNVFLPSSCHQACQAFSCSLWMDSWTQQLFPVKPDGRKT